MPKLKSCDDKNPCEKDYACINGKCYKIGGVAYTKALEKVKKTSSERSRSRSRSKSPKRSTSPKTKKAPKKAPKRSTSPKTKKAPKRSTSPKKETKKPSTKKAPKRSTSPKKVPKKAPKRSTSPKKEPKKAVKKTSPKKSPNAMTVVQLKEKLGMMGYPKTGDKKTLVDRYKKALGESGEQPPVAIAKAVEKAKDINVKIDKIEKEQKKVEKEKEKSEKQLDKVITKAKAIKKKVEKKELDECEKMTVLQLRAFLKKNGVLFSAKDKKEVLVKHCQKIKTPEVKVAVKDLNDLKKTAQKLSSDINKAEDKIVKLEDKKEDLIDKKIDIVKELPAKISSKILKEAPKTSKAIKTSKSLKLSSKELPLATIAKQISAPKEEKRIPATGEIKTLTEDQKSEIVKQIRDCLEKSME